MKVYISSSNYNVDKHCLSTKWATNHYTWIKLDESTAHRHLKSPRSLSARSLHLTLVTKWSWSWMTYSHPLYSIAIGPPILRCSYTWSRPCVWSKVKFTFDLENSNVMVMVKVKPDGNIQRLEFNRYVCFSFRGKPFFVSRSRSWPRSNLMVTFEALSSFTMFASWQSDHFLLKYSKFHIWPWNSRSRSWSRSNSMVTFEA